MSGARFLLIAVGVAGLMLVGTVSPRAHHSFAAEFDSTIPVTVTGTLSKVEWTAPHSWIYIDVKDSSGKVVTWGFEGFPPMILKRTGVSRDLLKIGELVSVTGWRARASNLRAAGRALTLAGGKKVFIGPEV